MSAHAILPRYVESTTHIRDIPLFGRGVTIRASLRASLTIHGEVTQAPHTKLLSHFCPKGHEIKKLTWGLNRGVLGSNTSPSGVQLGVGQNPVPLVNIPIPTTSQFPLKLTKMEVHLPQNGIPSQPLGTLKKLWLQFRAQPRLGGGYAPTKSSPS